jgi:hypothetical protein
LARRKLGSFTTHFAAMQLILAMEDKDGNYPNVDYVKAHQPPPQFTDPGFPTDPGSLALLQDMLPLVDPEVYNCFNQVLNSPTPIKIGDVTVDSDMVTNLAKLNSRLLQATTEQGKKAKFVAQALWDCAPPHPAPLVMREVIASLLA